MRGGTERAITIATSQRARLIWPCVGQVRQIVARPYFRLKERDHVGGGVCFVLRSCRWDGSARAIIKSYMRSAIACRALGISRDATFKMRSDAVCEMRGTIIGHGLP